MKPIGIAVAAAITSTEMLSGEERASNVKLVPTAELLHGVVCEPSLP